MLAALQGLASHPYVTIKDKGSGQDQDKGSDQDQDKDKGSDEDQHKGSGQGSEKGSDNAVGESVPSPFSVPGRLLVPLPLP